MRIQIVLGFGLAFLVGIAQSSVLPSGMIEGKVRSKADGSVLPSANVQVVGTIIGTTTRIDGSFRLPRVPAGNCMLEITEIGYAPRTVSLNVEDGGLVQITIDLEEQPAETPGVTIHAKAPLSAASSAMVNAANFDLLPRLSTQDLLRLVPGLVIAQHAGGGKAEQIFLRGFDADHGTDVNISVDGVPVNMVSHGHGQGYADLHFLMPEVLSGFEVFKGPYFTQYGDFGTAGSVKFNTLDTPERNSISAEAGEYGLYRLSGLSSLPIGGTASASLVAGEYLHNKSYFDHDQHFERVNVFAKWKTPVTPSATLSIWSSVFSSSWDASGQIPERAVASGLIDRFGSIDPSEGGQTNRQTINAIYTSHGESSDILIQSYETKYHFNLYSDFTFFKNDPVNGDEINQFDDRTIIGGRAELTIRPSANNYILLGASVRNDWIHNQLWHTAERVRLNGLADDDIRETNPALYGQEDIQLDRRAHVQAGLRGDLFAFDVRDMLHSGSADDITGTKVQAILSPKLNVTYSPSESLDLYGNFGNGFHSNDARGIMMHRDGKTLPRATGAEFGLRYSPTRTSTFGAALWLLDLENEFVYNGDDGTSEEEGPTRRVGVDLDSRVQLLDWLWADGDLTLSRGRFRDVSDSAAYIPLAPTVTSSGGITIRRDNGIEGTLRFRSIGDRPADEKNTVQAHGYTIFDAGAAFRTGSYKISFLAQNLFNTEWDEAQFDTESRLKYETAPVSEIHFTAGTPFSLRMKVEYGL